MRLDLHHWRTQTGIEVDFVLDGAHALTQARARGFLQSLKDWRLSPDAKSIAADYLMKNFAAAVNLINAIGGLSENDFILAAKIESLPKELKV